MLQAISSAILYFVQNWGHMKTRQQASYKKFRHVYRQIQVHAVL